MTALLAGSEGIREIIYRWGYIVLGATFVVTALVCSIRSSRTEEDAVTPIVRGPGGKPLPVTKRKKNRGFSGQGNGADLPEIGPLAKTVFKFLSGFLALTFFLNGVAVVFHAWKANRDLPAGQVNWWCGEPMVVSGPWPSCAHILGARVSILVRIANIAFPPFSRFTSSARLAYTSILPSPCSNGKPVLGWPIYLRGFLPSRRRLLYFCAHFSARKSARYHESMMVATLAAGASVSGNRSTWRSP